VLRAVGAELSSKLSEGFFIQEKNDSFSVPGMQQEQPHLEEGSE